VRCILTDHFEFDLSDVDPDRLRAAVHAALQQQGPARCTPPADGAHSSRLPSVARLRAGAQETLKEERQDARVVEYFQSLLEIGYLVASADGLAEAERGALARLMEQVSGSVLELRMLEQHLRDLDGSAAILGRHERLARVAASFEDAQSREEAIGFAALIAIADGKLAGPEAGVLLELGEHFSLSAGEVRAVASQVVASVKLALQG
jgi:tellurite resistance protein